MESLSYHKEVGNPTEAEEQRAVLEWASFYPSLKWLHAIPNGTHLAGDQKARAIKMSNLKAQGLKPGVFDLFLPMARGRYHGLYIEMKRRKNGRVSDDQKRFSQDVTAEGYQCVVCNGASEAIQAIRDYLAA
jgi:hypothetical protein